MTALRSADASPPRNRYPAENIAIVSSGCRRRARKRASASSSSRAKISFNDTLRGHLDTKATPSIFHIHFNLLKLQMHRTFESIRSNLSH